MFQLLCLRETDFTVWVGFYVIICNHVDPSWKFYNETNCESVRHVCMHVYIFNTVLSQRVKVDQESASC